MKKKLLSIILMILFLTSFSFETMAVEELNIKGKSALLMDANTGEIIYEMNKDEGLPPASITKVMTMLLGLEAVKSGKISLDDEVLISNHASSMGGTQVYLEAGEIQVAEELFKAIAIRSANDAAVALGEHIAGSEDLFVAMMNKRAKEVGMENTYFKNASGLPNEEHYVSAYDVALMSRELLKHDIAKEWMTTYIYDMKVGKNKDDIQTMVNTNKLIKQYKDVTGIKTGSTNEAGFCLSASAKRGNLELIAVIMGADTSKNRFDEAKRMLDYGFANYDSLIIGKKEDVLGSVKVEKGKVSKINAILEEDSFILLSKGEESNIDKEIILPESIEAPLEAGEEIGTMIITLNGNEIHRIKLVSKYSIEKASFVDILKRSLKSFIDIQ